MDLKERRHHEARLDSWAQPSRHPWEVARLRFVSEQLTKHDVLPTAKRVLDVGAGDAWLASNLADRFQETDFTCVDAFYSAADVAEIGANRSNLSAARELGAEGAHRYDLITALDVIEHVDDDHGFLGTLVTDHLEPTGRVMITVPAWQPLWASHDVHLEHRRRYSPALLSELLKGAGLEAVSTGGFFHSLLGPRALTVARERLFGAPTADSAGGGAGVASWNAGRMVTAAVNAALRLDNRITTAFQRYGVQLPGLSLWALCRPAEHDAAPGFER